MPSTASNTNALPPSLPPRPLTPTAQTYYTTRPLVVSAIHHRHKNHRIKSKERGKEKRRTTHAIIVLIPPRARHGLEAAVVVRWALRHAWVGGGGAALGSVLSAFFFFFCFFLFLFRRGLCLCLDDGLVPWWEAGGMREGGVWWCVFSFSTRTCELITLGANSFAVVLVSSRLVSSLFHFRAGLGVLACMNEWWCLG
ncbi:hypothetical protein EJ03DRAFT_117566 [Teratosphaeria nubilosa]|uniref:Uncharacterized protein n=1 Tax=Teratosphaeria nubilosa TaxID=161662 RepID=A0A6G1L6I1_9PEZI|nr:hypothetical protein EJ03DRAFT_117566 [Teratosphaeria nubilosa]